MPSRASHALEKETTAKAWFPYNRNDRNDKKVFCDPCDPMETIKRCDPCDPCDRVVFIWKPLLRSLRSYGNQA